MASYEDLPTLTLPQDNQLLVPEQLPEVVHLDDPAIFVMIDFKRTKPPVAAPDERIDDALNEMKVRGYHWLLVVDQARHVAGFIASEDILGEKPIKLMEERRIGRHDILVKMVMSRNQEVLAIDISHLKYAKVAHIVNTLKHKRKHYALVIEHNEQGHSYIRGLFSSSQISRQLHMDINNGL